MLKIAVVTGASSGLGRAYARQLDRMTSLDEMWLIARRAERLQELAGELECKCRVLPMDLKRRESVEALEAMLAEEKPGAGGGLLCRLPALAGDEPLRRHQGLFAALYPGPALGAAGAGGEGDGDMSLLDQDGI